MLSHNIVGQNSPLCMIIKLKNVKVQQNNVVQQIEVVLELEKIEKKKAREREKREYISMSEIYIIY